MSGHCGFVTIAGRPNVGKSTLLNVLLGQKISITSSKPQTTRHTLLGIKTFADDQIIYVDTPGLQTQHRKAINRYMNKAATGALVGVDLVLFVIEANKWLDEDEWVLELLKEQQLPLLLVINKVDELENPNELLPVMEQLNTKHSFLEICPLSALQNDNIDTLERLILMHLPIAALVFPEDQLTDRSERFLAAEIIREKLMRRLGSELPYQLSVEIELFKAEGKLLRIAAIIWVERDSQKAIVIGKHGELLKIVGSEARKDMQTLFDCKIFLQLWVKVKSGWSNDEKALHQLGYTDT